MIKIRLHNNDSNDYCDYEWEDIEDMCWKNKNILTG